MLTVASLGWVGDFGFSITLLLGGLMFADYAVLVVSIWALRLVRLRTWIAVVVWLCCWLDGFVDGGFRVGGFGCLCFLVVDLSAGYSGLMVCGFGVFSACDFGAGVWSLSCLEVVVLICACFGLGLGWGICVWLGVCLRGVVWLDVIYYTVWVASVCWVCEVL